MEVQIIFAHFQGYLMDWLWEREFPDKELSALWNCWISRRATVPGQYFLVFLTLPSWRNSFWGALPPTVGWGFLLTGSSPKAESPASTAIWANCLVGNDDGDLPTSSSHLASSTLLLSLFHCLLHLFHRWGPSGWGWVVHRWWWSPPSLCQLPPLFSRAELPPLPLLFFLWGHFCSCHSIK